MGKLRRGYDACDDWFQSPLHRGMSSDDIGSQRDERFGSFNPLFIGACHRILTPTRPGTPTPAFQSPLHRGMSSDKSGDKVYIGKDGVSIPSSSGHVIGYRMPFAVNWQGLTQRIPPTATSGCEPKATHPPWQAVSTLQSTVWVFHRPATSRKLQTSPQRHIGQMGRFWHGFAGFRRSNRLSPWRQ